MPFVTQTVSLTSLYRARPSRRRRSVCLGCYQELSKVWRFFSQRSCQSQRAVKGILGIFNSLLLSLGGLPHKTSKLLTGEMQEPRERHCEFLRLNEVQRVALLFSSVFDLHASVVFAVADVVAAVADA